MSERDKEVWLIVVKVVGIVAVLAVVAWIGVAVRSWEHNAIADKVVERLLKEVRPEGKPR